MFKMLKKIIIKIKYGQRLIGSKFEIRKNASIKISQRGLVELGKCLINENAFVCASNLGKITIKDNVTINRNTIIVAKKNIYIGDGSSIGPNVCIYDHDHKYDANGFKKDEFTAADIYIGKNVWIGANVMILKGSNIEDNCVIGAGTIIKGLVRANSIVYNARDIIEKKMV